MEFMLVTELVLKFTAWLKEVAPRNMDCMLVTEVVLKFRGWLKEVAR